MCRYEELWSWPTVPQGRLLRSRPPRWPQGPSSVRPAPYPRRAGGRWVPFVEGGVGAAYTNIAGRDLSEGFQFNLQAGGALTTSYERTWR
jgi:Lipid A 3-O-deacylase (PagL)